MPSLAEKRDGGVGIPAGWNKVAWGNLSSIELIKSSWDQPGFSSRHPNARIPEMSPAGRQMQAPD